MKGPILVISSTIIFGAPNAHARRTGNIAGFLLPKSSTGGLSCVDRITFGNRQRQKIKSIQRVPLRLRRCPSKWHVLPCLELKRSSTENENYINIPLDNTSIMASMEKEVRASAQATLDLKRVKEALTVTTPLSSREKDNDNDASYYTSSSSSSSLPSSTSMRVLNSPNSTPSDIPPPSQWKIALAAGLAATLVSFLLFQQPLLSFACFLTTTIVAARDPIDEKSILVDGEDDVAGPLARLIGRATLQSIEGSTPKVRAITRAAVTGNAEIDSLRGRIRELERENTSLSLWVERRRYVDEHVGRFKLDQLKASARKEGLTVGGTKVQVMMRLA
eukprot:CAMPEP_0198257498 /NCGR_PEP_ID=MMETSP1447-20131203/7167_1 /TAXON_ID=420782 /ORGANISM="Chaetoceros dichaeta, Strain CCMP1751" /LENGTH=332 /DNA_ID=CAMNT_0043944417 /DNA_START=137 /DNA_END=1131 /DNA_ORIENTATION=-